MAAQNLMPQCGSTQTRCTAASQKQAGLWQHQQKNMLYRGRTKSPLQCGIIQTAALQQHKNTPRFGSRKNKNQKKLMHCGNTHNTLHCNTIICYIVAAQQMRCTGAALDTRGTRNGGPKTMWHHKKQIQTTTTKKPSSLIAKKNKKYKKYCSTAAAAGQKTRCTAAAQKPCCPVVAQKSKNKTNKKPCPAAAHKKHAALRQHKAKNPNMPPSGCTKNTHCTVAALKKHAALRQQKLKNCTLHCGCTRKMRHCDSTKKNAAQETESPKTIL